MSKMFAKEMTVRKKERKSNSTRSNQIFNGLIIIGLFGLLFTILVGLFGKAGGYVKDFFVGVFGFSIYGITLAMIFIGILMLVGWSSKNTKIGKKLCYVVILALVIAMSHLALTRNINSLGYGKYLSECFNGSGTPAGWLGGLLLYPLGKLYVFSMVIMGLLLAGFVVLAIVMNINYEIVFPSRAKKVKFFDKKQNAGRGHAQQNENFEEEPVREMYNGTVSGKKLSDNFSKTYSNKPLEYTPLENLELGEEEEQPYFEEEKPLLVNPQEVDEQTYYKRQSALDFLYSQDDDGYRRRTGEVDVSRTMNQIRGVTPNTLNIPPMQEPAQPEQNNVVETPNNFDLDDKFKSYSTNYRSKQMLENMGIVSEEPTFSNQEQNDFMKEIENALNNSIGNISTSETQPIIDEQPSHVESTVSPVTSNEQPTEEEKNEQDQAKLDRAERLRILKEKQQARNAQKQAELNQNTVDQGNEVVETPYNMAYKSLDPRQNPITPTTPASSTQPARPVTSVSPVVSSKSMEAPKPPRKITPYIPPSIDCLADYEENIQVDNDYLQGLADILKDKMVDYGVNIDIVGIVKGPTFSRIEFEIDGPVGKITSRYNDISMWLGVESMRLEAPIPGKRYCGIEIPNKTRGTVGLKPIINSPEFNAKKDGLRFALGKDIDGNCYVSDICSFPHALVAGASGAGKSVCLNAMLCSLLYKYSPEELRLILVDPKVVELNIYRDIPHLLIPQILSEEKKVINALKWAVDEMEKRYLLMTDLSVANLKQYNEEVGESKTAEKLPYILIVIDEVGDIILSSVGKEFQQLIKKLAAKARAAGIHIILATQRPSVDVITGTIKSNLPTRIAFAVTSGVDSKTILDTVGAEKLLRYGDMLYKEAAKPHAVRVQGAFIHTKEVRKIVEQVKEKNTAYYDEDIVNAINKEEEPPANDIESDKKVSAFPDELCPEALDFGLENGEVSISSMQRKFGLGFNRAGKIFDWMKSIGAIRVEGKKNFFAMTEEQVDEIKQKAIDGDEE